MSAGIRSRLLLAGLVADEATARLVQIGLEYDPMPPSGGTSVDDAEPADRELVRQVVQAQVHHLEDPDAPAAPFVVMA